MNREEAVNTLGNFKRYISGGGVTDLKANEALDMAIEALKADIVRCGECKHLMPDGRCWEFADDAIRPSASDFCSYGERREDE